MASRFLNNNTYQQFAKFLLVGGSTVVVELVIFIMLESVLGVPLLPAHIASFILAAGYNFALNRKHVFGAERIKAPLLKYAALALINVMLGSFVVVQLAQVLPNAAAKLATIILIAGWNFILYKFVVFSEKQEFKI